MQCPHCLVELSVEPIVVWIGDKKDTEGKWEIRRYVCPKKECGKSFFDLCCLVPTAGGHRLVKIVKAYPKVSGRTPVPIEVPQEFAEDYTEACLVLTDSPKASAALSRRCLQHILREKASVKPSSLAAEIQQVLDEAQMPSYLAENLDAIRNIGNFAAHPNKSEHSGEVVPVEPEEAKWNLDVLEGLFDFYFVQPERMKEKRSALDEKLVETGKPPMKQPQNDIEGDK